MPSPMVTQVIAMAPTINKADYTKDNAAVFEVEATADLGNFIRRTTITDAGRLIGWRVPDFLLVCPRSICG